MIKEQQSVIIIKFRKYSISLQLNLQNFWVEGFYIL